MTIGSQEWIDHNREYIDRFQGASDRSIIEHFAILDFIDPSMPTLFILHALICSSVLQALDPAISKEARELYTRGYADGITGNPSRYGTLDLSDDSEEHF